jgi:5-methylcytosine-specific restriction endonuclease McrA
MTFRKAAAIRWQQQYGDDEWGPCEGWCGTWVPRGTAPHHVRAAGLGGKRDHSPDNLRILCHECHLREHRRK